MVLFDRVLAKMRQAVQRWKENSIRNALPVSLEQTRTLPASRQSLAQRQQFNLLKTASRHPFEIEVRENKIHHQAGRASSRITTTLQHFTKDGKVFSRFQSVKVVRMLAELYSVLTQGLVAFAVTNSHAAPVVALEDVERAIDEKERSFGLPSVSAPEPLSHVPHS